jgi:hypothetical protein
LSLHSLRIKVSLLILIELSLLLSSGILVLLVLRHEVIHVALGLSELHLVHALASVPVKESLTPEHGCELLCHSLPYLLDGRGVAHKSGRHLETLGGDVANGGLHVVGDPLHKVAGVLVDDVEHLLIHLLGAHAAAEHYSAGEVASMAGVAGAHHILGIEALLRQLGHSQGAVLLAATAGERCKANHKEVETREGNHVDCQLAEITVQLPREAQTASGSADGRRHQVVQVAISGGCELQGSEANIIEGLVIKGEALVRVLHQLMHGECGIVGLDDGVANLGRGDNTVGGHDSIGVLLANLADKEGSHSRSGTSTHGVSQLESLQAVTALCLLAHYVQNGVNQLSTLCVVALGPVVAGTSLAENEVVGSEELAIGTRAYTVHGPRLQIHQNGAGHVSAASGFVEIAVDALQLEVAVAMVSAGRINSVLVGDDLPKLGTNLVTALSRLTVAVAKGKAEAVVVAAG